MTAPRESNRLVSANAPLIPELAALLASLFEDEELIWFIGEGRGGEELLAAVEGAAATELAGRVAAELVARGLPDVPYFKRLRMARPAAAEQVRALEVRWFAVPEPIPTSENSGEVGEAWTDAPLFDVTALTVAEARTEQQLELLAKITGLEVAAIATRLADADDRAMAQQVLRDRWPSAKQLGDLTIAAARRRGLLPSVAARLELSLAELRVRCEKLHGRARVRNLAEGHWPELDEAEDDLGNHSAARALIDEVDELADLTKLSQPTVRRRLKAAAPDTPVREVFAKEWPSVDDIGEWSIARIRMLGFVPTVAQTLGLPLNEVEVRLASERANRQIRRVFAEQWPEPDPGLAFEASPDVDLDELLDRVPFGQLTVARARHQDIVQRLAIITGQDAPSVVARLTDVDPRTKLCNVFPDEWPKPSKLLGYTIGKLFRCGLVGELAVARRVEAAALRSQLAGVKGHTKVRNALAASDSPRDEKPSERREPEPNDEVPKVSEAKPEVEPEPEPSERRDGFVSGFHPEVRVRQLAGTLGPLLLAEIVDRKPSEVLERLSGARPRTLVRKLFADVWPNVQQLAGWPAARVLRLGVVHDVASFVGMPSDVVERRLQAAHWRESVSSLFREEWSDPVVQASNSITERPGELPRLGARPIGGLRVHELREGLACTVVAELTGLSLSQVFARLEDASDGSRANAVFAAEWPSDEDFGEFSVARVLRLGLVPELARVTGRDAIEIDTRLIVAHQNQQVWEVLSDDWPYAYVDETLPEPPKSESIFDLSRTTAAEARRREMAPVIAEVTGLAVEDVARQLASVHGRTRVKNAIADHWPTSDQLGSMSARLARRCGLAGAITEATTLTIVEVDARLATAQAQTSVRTLFADEWPEWDYELEDQEADATAEDGANEAVVDAPPVADEAASSEEAEQSEAEDDDIEPGEEFEEEEEDDEDDEDDEEDEDEEDDEEDEDEEDEDEDEAVEAKVPPSAPVPSAFEQTGKPLAEKTVFRVLRDGLVAVLNELTNLGLQALERRLREANSRSLVRSVVPEIWDGVEQFGKLTACKAVRTGRVSVIAEVVGGSYADIHARLGKATGRATVARVLGMAWPNAVDGRRRSRASQREANAANPVEEVQELAPKETPVPEPMISEPVVSEPAVPEPVVSEPALLEPAPPEPAPPKPATAATPAPESVPAEPALPEPAPPEPAPPEPALPEPAPPEPAPPAIVIPTPAPTKPKPANPIRTIRPWMRDFDDLHAEFHSRNLIAFVGAGMPMAAGMPGWATLAVRLRSQVEDRLDPPTLAEISEFIHQRKLIDAMSALKLAIGPPTFDRLVEQLLDDSHVEPPPLARAIADLRPELRAVLTTNLDTLLERAFAGRWWATAKMLPDIPRRKNYILKLHGTIQDRASWVFTQEQYDRVMYRDPAYRELFTAIFITSPLLFIGYGLMDADFDEVIRRVRSYAGSQPPSHFALMPEHEITPLRRSQLEDGGIRLLPYSADDHHAELLEILRRLKSG